MTPAALRRRVRGMRLGVKLAGLSAALTSIVVLATFAVLSVQSRKTITREVVDQVRTNQRMLIHAQEMTREELLRSALFLTQQGWVPYLKTAGQSLDPRMEGTADDELMRIRPVIGKDLLLITTKTGQVFAVAGRRGDTSQVPRTGEDLSRVPAVRVALDSSAPSDSGSLAILRRGTAVYQIAVAPLVQDGFTVGSALVGERIDSVLARADTGMSVVVTAGSSELAGSPDLSGSDLAALDRSGVTSGQQGSLLIAGRQVVVAPLALGRTQDGVGVTLWLMQSAAPAVGALTATLARSFLLAALVAVVLAGLGAALVARSVLRPLNRFMAFMRLGAATDRFDARFDATDASPEVRTLNESFSDLMGSLSEERHQLERRTTELAAANTGLREEVRERERVERALRESEAQLRQSQKLEAIGTLAGGIAHDFNNLLTVISGYSQLALMRSGRESAGAADLQQVIEAAERAANLTHQLLAFSRKQVMQPTVLDLGQVVDGVAPMLQRLIGEHIELRIERGEELGRILADRGQLEQVIINLVVNARDAMPHGGVVTIRTANVDDAPFGPVTATGLRGVSLSVADTGSGIPDEIRDRIFEPFFTTKELGKGTGLGLSTVYGIIKQSGGTVDVESRVGHGTTFTIVMPPADELVGVAGLVSTKEEFPRGSETILLVEDEEDVRTLARRTLEEVGYTVIAAEDAEQAVALLAASRIDVLLTDIVMPHHSGPQLVKRAQALASSPVVIYMSGYADEALETFELDPSVTFLRKPFTPMALARTVREALDAARENTRAAAR